MYKSKNYEHLLGTKGFSDAILKNHFKLYDGYVTNVNKLSTLIAGTDVKSPEYAELKRRFGWEYNGMRLHELYFGNIKKESKDINQESILYKKIVTEFDSYKKWEEDFKAVGAMRGIGWAVLSYDKESGRIFNVWINEHNTGHLAGSEPVLVMDVFEHAFVLDYGLSRADYITAFMSAIDWANVESRIQ